MSTPGVQTRASIARLNKPSIAAMACAVIAASGFWIYGIAALAGFAVGAGHVALSQIRISGERGRGLAIAALAVGYGIATLALVTVLGFAPSTIQQFLR